MTTFDFASAKHQADKEEDGTVVPILHIDGTPATYEKDGQKLPSTIKVVGRYSPTFRKAEAEQRRQMAQSATRDFSDDDISRRQAELIASCVQSWEGLTNGGQHYACTRENAIALLLACPWIREACERAMGDHRRFFATGSGN